MTQAADIQRDHRRAFALPGGFHDRLVARLATWLPAAIGVIIAVMVLTPLSPRGEISFMLDRNKVAIARDRVKVENAMYRGVDDQGRMFSVNASSAVQASARDPLVYMEQLSAKLNLAEGPAQVSASDGVYDYNRELVTVRGMVDISAPDGYRLQSSGVSIDLGKRLVTGENGISGAIPGGVFSANSIRADLGARTVTLEGRARLTMTPGQLRMP